MSLMVSGLSHHTSSLELRERLAFPEAAVPDALHVLKKHFPEEGALILSTCNRTELYIRSEKPPEEVFGIVRGFIAATRAVPEAEFAEALYELHDREAVTHLFRVASSLDSLVVGEDQILAQVHAAYDIAHAAAATDKILSTCFQRAFKVAKEVRTKTNIGGGKVSVASVAAELAASVFTDLSEKTVLIIGSGETGELALKSMVKQGVKNVIVANRTLAKAVDLAAQYHGEAVDLEAMRRQLHRADIVVSSTSATEPILTAADFQQALKARDKAPMFVIDIAVPRDIEEAVHQLDNVYLYDMDDLQQVAEANLAARRAEVAKCMEIVEAQVDQFVKWRQGLHAEPTIVSMSQEWNQIRERELAKTLAALPDLTEKQRDEVTYLTKRIVNNLLQRPMTQIKQEVTQEDPHRVLHLVKRLFGLEEGGV